jgi:hypothetical protein
MHIHKVKIHQILTFHDGTPTPALGSADEKVTETSNKPTQGVG